MKADQTRWNKRFKGKEFALGKEPNPFLKKYLPFLPIGKALDIAAGEGRNAVFLALHGFEVDAVDISEEGLRKVRKSAKEAGVRVHTIRSDLDVYPIEEKKYDLDCQFLLSQAKPPSEDEEGVKEGREGHLRDIHSRSQEARRPRTQTSQIFSKTERTDSAL